jgi:hypothetical protein
MDIKPDYQLLGGRIAPNDEARQLIQTRFDIERQYLLLNAAQTGATLTDIFLRLAWLDTFVLDITSYHESGDRGDPYLSHLVSVSEAIAVEGMQYPDDVCCEGAFHADHAALFIETTQLGSFDARALYKLSNHDDVDTISFRLERRRLQAVLDTTPVSGREAFHALFPEIAA